MKNKLFEDYQKFMNDILQKWYARVASEVQPSDLKHYAALFTCFSSCAVHIKITNAIDADSFIMALCRLLARRGSV